jgi:hypothetical protein
MLADSLAENLRPLASPSIQSPPLRPFMTALRCASMPRPWITCERLKRFPVVSVLGPRQVGKTGLVVRDERQRMPELLSLLRVSAPVTGVSSRASYGRH